MLMGQYFARGTHPLRAAVGSQRVNAAALDTNAAAIDKRGGKG